MSRATSAPQRAAPAAAPSPEARALLGPAAELYPFASHWHAVDGHRLHYVDEGPRDAPCVVLLHGNPTWSFLFRDLVRELARDHRVIAPDHLGCGLSDKPARGPWRLADHVERLAELLAAAGVERASLVLHDWGGAIGMGWATRDPARVERLVLLNTAAFRGPCPLRIRLARTPLLGRLAVQGLNAFAGLAARMATARPGGLPPLVRRGLLAPYRSWGERVATWRFVMDIPLAPAHPSWDTLVAIEERLQAFAEHPALIVWGERDWCFTPAFRREWERRLPRARSHPLQGAGHYVLEDAGEEARRLVADFLRDTPPHRPG